MRLAGYRLAALTLATAWPASAQDLPAAQTFVAGLYAAYHGKGPDYLGRQGKATFAPDLLRLFHQVAQTTPAGEVGALDGDPICDCQDFAISKVSIQVTPGATPGQAHAVVRFLNFSDPQKVELDLIASEGHWRVSDVHTPDTPSLVAYLKRSVADVHSRK